jgi:hypothetical protein
MDYFLLMRTLAWEAVTLRALRATPDEGVRGQMF